MKEIEDKETISFKRRIKLINKTVPLHPDTLKAVEELASDANSNTPDYEIPISPTEILRYAIEFAMGNRRFKAIIKNRLL